MAVSYDAIVIGGGHNGLTHAAYLARAGKLALSEFATDPCRSIFKRLMTVFDPQVTDNTAVALTELGDRHYAMTEGQISVQFDPIRKTSLYVIQSEWPLCVSRNLHTLPRAQVAVNLSALLAYLCLQVSYCRIQIDIVLIGMLLQILQSPFQFKNWFFKI